MYVLYRYVGPLGHGGVVSQTGSSYQPCDLNLTAPRIYTFMLAFTVLSVAVSKRNNAAKDPKFQRIQSSKGSLPKGACVGPLVVPNCVIVPFRLPLPSPYIRTSPSQLSVCFTSAFKRPNLWKQPHFLIYISISTSISIPISISPLKEPFKGS